MLSRSMTPNLWGKSATGGRKVHCRGLEIIQRRGKQKKLFSVAQKSYVNKVVFLDFTLIAALFLVSNRIKNNNYREGCNIQRNSVFDLKSLLESCQLSTSGQFSNQLLFVK